MPKCESERIATDEILLRRIPFAVWDDGKCDVSPQAFRPSSSDKDGISLFRDACLASPFDFLNEIVSLDKRNACGVAGVEVIEVHRVESLRLHVTAKPIESTPGHVVIPELNCNDYDRKGPKKDAIKNAMATLASVASKNVLRKPCP